MVHSKAKLNSNGDKAVENRPTEGKTEICAKRFFFCFARYVVSNQVVSDNAEIFKVSFEFSHLLTHRSLHKITSILLHTLQFSGVPVVLLRASITFVTSTRPFVHTYQFGPGWNYVKRGSLLLTTARTCSYVCQLHKLKAMSPSTATEQVTLYLKWLRHRAGVKFSNVRLA
jgi:hypothetical protein